MSGAFQSPVVVLRILKAAIQATQPPPRLLGQVF
jgi:hypothetical protein